MSIVAQDGDQHKTNLTHGTSVSVWNHHAFDAQVQYIKLIENIVYNLHMYNVGVNNMLGYIDVMFNDMETVDISEIKVLGFKVVQLCKH